MTWVLLHDDRVVATGAYRSMIEMAEEWGACARAWHLDGTELAPRLERAWFILPRAMVPAARSEAA